MKECCQNEVLYIVLLLCRYMIRKIIMRNFGNHFTFQFIQILEILIHQLLINMKQEVISDQGLEAMLNQLKISDPQLSCSEGNNIKRVCINPQCPLSLICENDQCTVCGISVHQCCPTIPFDRITLLLNRQINNYRDFVSSMFEIENKCIATIHQNRKKINLKFEFNNLQPKYQEIIAQIYKHKNTDFLKGKDAESFYKILAKQKNKSSQNSKVILAQYQNKLDQMIINMESLKQFYQNKYSKGDYQSQLSKLKEYQNQKEKITKFIDLQNQIDLSANDVCLVKLKKMFKALEVVQPKQIKCDKGNNIFKMCVSPDCQKYSLMCNQSDCEVCEQKHEEDCTFTFLDNLTKLMNKKTRSYQQLSANICEIESQFIQKLRLKEQQYAIKYSFGDFTKEQLAAIESIYTNKNAKNLLSRQANKILLKLQQSTQISKLFTQKLCEGFKSDIGQLIDKINNEKQILYHTFISCQSIPKSIISGKQDKINYYATFMRQINKSKIANSLSTEVLNWMGTALNYPKKAKLLFRASEYNFRAFWFHQKCDHYNNTLTLVRTQFGRTIAGYSYYTWNQTNGVLKDSKRNCFLLHLQLKQKMIPNTDQNLIYCFSSYGPVFGAQSSYYQKTDLQIIDRCNEYNSKSHFPRYYNSESNKKYQRNSQTYKLFTGSTNQDFKVQQYQVFHLQY